MEYNLKSISDSITIANKISLIIFYYVSIVANTLIGEPAQRVTFLYKPKNGVVLSYIKSFGTVWYAC